MSLEDRGAYLELLIYLYEGGGTIKDLDHAIRIWRAAGVTGKNRRSFAKLWANIAPMFRRNKHGSYSKLAHEILKNGGKVRGLGGGDYGGAFGGGSAHSTSTSTSNGHRESVDHYTNGGDSQRLPSRPRTTTQQQPEKTTIGDYTPGDVLRARFARAGINRQWADPGNPVLEKFCAHHRSRGTLSASWDDEFFKWCIDEKNRPGGVTHAERSHDSGARRNRGDRIDQALDEIEQEAASG